MSVLRQWLSGLLFAALLLAAVSAQAMAPPLNRSLLSTDTYQRLNSAQQMLANGDYAGALARLNSLLPRVQSNGYELAVTQQNIAYVYISRDDYQGALPYMLRAMQQNALPPEAQRALVLDLAKLYARTGQYSDARRVLDALQQAGPVSSMDAEMLAATLDARQGRCREALPHIQRALQASAAPPESWYQLQLSCLYQLHEYDGAVNVLYTLLGRWPDRSSYWRQLGENYAQLGDGARALAVYALMQRQGLLQSEQDYLTLMSLYLQNREPYQAGQVLGAGLQAGTVTANEANYRLLAQAWLAARDQDKAIAALGQAARLAQNGEPYLQQAELYQQTHEWFSVIDATQKALAKGGMRRPGRAWLLQGIARTQNKQYPQAETALKQAEKYDDSRAQAEIWLRYLQTRSGGQTS